MNFNVSFASFVSQRLNIDTMLKDISRIVLLYTISGPFCCDHEQCGCDISWWIRSVDQQCLL